MGALIKSRSFLSVCALLSSLAFSCGGGGGGGSGEFTTPGTTTTPTQTKSLKTSVLGRVSTQSVSKAAPIVNLTVDTNGDGIFDQSDKSYRTVVKEGKFQILGVEVPQEGAKAKLTVKADGYATYTKVINLQPQTSVNLNVSLAPASTAVVNLSQKRSPGEKLIFTLTKDGRLEVSKNVRSVSIENSQINLAIDEGSIPQGTTKLKVSMKAFNSANPQEVKYFPGEFKGEAPDGGGEVGLKSVSFAFIQVEDQDGNPINLKATKASKCIYEITQTLPKEAVKTIKERGDFNKTQPGCQAPIYSYNGNSEKWEFLGTGTVVGVSDCQKLQEGQEYKIDICITKANWGDYVNLDYPIYYEEVKEVTFCFVLKDAEGNPIPDAWFEVYTDGYYDSDYTDEKGVARTQILSNDQNCDALLSKFGFSYLSPTTGGWITLQPSQLQSTSASGCTCAYEVKESAFLTEVKVVASNHNGDPITGTEVCLADEDYTYYQCSTTDDKGEATFFAVPNRRYEAFGPNLTEVEKVVLPSVKNVFVLTLDNNLPEINLHIQKTKVVQGEKATINLYAYDPDGDPLQLKELLCGDNKAQVITSRSEDGYLEVGAVCPADKVGEVAVKATVSDGKEESSATVSFEVVEKANQPPVVYGISIADSEGNIVDAEELKTSNSYKVIVYAYDPDGDKVSYFIEGEGCSVSGDEITCSFVQPGSYEIKVVATDGKAQTEIPLKLKVADKSLPPEVLALYFDKYVASPGESLEVYLYAEDKDSQELSAKAYAGEEAQDLRCKALGDGYFECSGKITLPQKADADYLTIAVEVSDGNSVAKAQGTVLINRGNLAPQFTLPLPEKLELKPGESYTFKAEAQDPEGGSINYTWFVNGKKVAEGSSQLTYTFKEPGLYQVKVEASDGEKISSSQSTVVVAQKGELVFRYGVEGVYVSLLDDDLNIVKTVKSNSEGVADLGSVNRPTVNVSVVISPDVVVNKEMLFKKFTYAILWNSRDVESIKEIDKWYKEGKVPKETAASILYSEDLVNADTNGDGYIDKDELWSYELSLKDADGDGKLTLKELKYTATKVVILKDIPVGEYERNLTDEIIFGSEFHPYIHDEEFEDSLERSYKFVEIRVKNVPITVNANIYLTNSLVYDTTNNGSEAVVRALIPLQDNGKYSTIVINQTDNGTTLYVVKDETSDNLTIDYSDFKEPTVVKVFNPLNPDKWSEYISISTRYEGIGYEIGYWTNLSNEGLRAVDPFGSGISLFYEKSRDEGSAGWASWSLSISLPKLPESIDLSDLRSKLLPVEASIEDGKVELSGIGMAEVDEVIAGVNVYSYDGSVAFRVRTPYSADQLPLEGLKRAVPQGVIKAYIEPIENSAEGRRNFVSVLDAQNYNWKCSYNRSCQLGDFRVYNLFVSSE